MPTSFPHLSGVYAAVVTPLKDDFSPDYDSLPALLSFLARRGCHGALLLGTTGEGPSFAPNERIQILRSALNVRGEFPDFHLMLGTGTSSLEETAALTCAAFEQGADGVVVLPPFYFRQVTVDGLFAWYSQVIRRSVPDGGAFLAYHYPKISGVPLPLELLTRLKDAFPDRFAGLKDSSLDLDHARLLNQTFGDDLLIFTGSDTLFSVVLGLQHAGCITALANLCSPALRSIWDAHQREEIDLLAQGRLKQARDMMDANQPPPAFLKALLAYLHHFPAWTVRPPLLPLDASMIPGLAAAFAEIWNG